MSLQDDYFELSASLRGENKKRFICIWTAFCEMEAEHESLEKIRNCLRTMIELTFEDKEKK